MEPISATPLTSVEGDKVDSAANESKGPETESSQLKVEAPKSTDEEGGAETQDGEKRKAVESSGKQNAKKKVKRSLVDTSKLTNPKASKGSKSGAPTYIDMIRASLIELKDKKGSSVPAMKKWILNKWPQAKSASFGNHFNKALKTGVQKTVLIKVGVRYKFNMQLEKKLTLQKERDRRQRAQQQERNRKKKEKEKEMQKNKSKKKEHVVKLHIAKPPPPAPQTESDIPMNLLVDIVNIAEFFKRFSQELKVTPFSHVMLYDAMIQSKLTDVLYEPMFCLLKKKLESDAKSDRTLRHGGWYKILNSMTWEEILRRYLLRCTQLVKVPYKSDLLEAATSLEKKKFIELSLECKVRVMKFLVDDIVEMPFIGSAIDDGLSKVIEASRLKFHADMKDSKLLRELSGKTSNKPAKDTNPTGGENQETGSQGENNGDSSDSSSDEEEDNSDDSSGDESGVSETAKSTQTKDNDEKSQQTESTEELRKKFVKAKEEVKERKTKREEDLIKKFEYVYRPRGYCLGHDKRKREYWVFDADKTKLYVSMPVQVKKPRGPRVNVAPKSEGSSVPRIENTGAPEGQDDQHMEAPEEPREEVREVAKIETGTATQQQATLPASQDQMPAGNDFNRIPVQQLQGAHVAMPAMYPVGHVPVSVPYQAGVQFMAGTPMGIPMQPPIPVFMQQPYAVAVPNGMYVPSVPGNPHVMNTGQIAPQQPELVNSESVVTQQQAKTSTVEINNAKKDESAAQVSGTDPDKAKKQPKTMSLKPTKAQLLKASKDASKKDFVWGFYSTKEEVNKLLKSLDKRIPAEASLLRRLRLFFDDITKRMKEFTAATEEKMKEKQVKEEEEKKLEEEARMAKELEEQKASEDAAKALQEEMDQQTRRSRPKRSAALSAINAIKEGGSKQPKQDPSPEKSTNQRAPSVKEIDYDEYDPKAFRKYVNLLKETSKEALKPRTLDDPKILTEVDGQDTPTVLLWIFSEVKDLAGYLTDHGAKLPKQTEWFERIQKLTKSAKNSDEYTSEIATELGELLIDLEVAAVTLSNEVKVTLRTDGTEDDDDEVIEKEWRRVNCENDPISDNILGLRITHKVPGGRRVDGEITEYFPSDSPDEEPHMWSADMDNGTELFFDEQMLRAALIRFLDTHDATSSESSAEDSEEELGSDKEFQEVMETAPAEKLKVWRNVQTRLQWLASVDCMETLSATAFVVYALSSRVQSYIEAQAEKEVEKEKDRKEREKERLARVKKNRDALPYGGTQKVVWAKVKGYAIWPAEEIIFKGKKVSQNSVPVLFFATNETAILTKKQVYDFDPLDPIAGPSSYLEDNPQAINDEEPDILLKLAHRVARIRYKPPSRKTRSRR